MNRFKWSWALEAKLELLLPLKVGKWKACWSTVVWLAPLWRVVEVNEWKHSCPCWIFFLLDSEIPALKNVTVKSHSLAKACWYFTGHLVPGVGLLSLEPCTGVVEEKETTTIFSSAGCICGCARTSHTRRTTSLMTGPIIYYLNNLCPAFLLLKQIPKAAYRIL